MGASGDVAARKRALRTRLQAARDARPTTERDAGNRARRALAAALLDPLLDALPDSAGAGGAVIAAYLPVGSEPGLATPTGQDLADEVLERGGRVLLPIVGPRMVLGWAPYRSPDALVRSRFGLLEPAGRAGPPALVAEAGLVVVPAMAIDHAGYRLGKGAGCYDGALPHARPGVPLLAVLDSDDELVDTVPAEPHDRRVTHVVTPTRLLSLPVTSG